MKVAGTILTTLVTLGLFAGTPQTKEAAIEQQMKALESTIAAHGGMDAIDKKVIPFRADVMKKVVQSKQRYAQVEGHGFQSGITRGNMVPRWAKDAEEGFTGFGALKELDQELSKLGVSFMVVPVPAKFELYGHLINDSMPKGFPLSPARTEMMMALSKAGVEVIDLLPALQEALPTAEHSLYEVNGHHLSSLGATVASEVVADRLSRFDFKDRDPSRYGMKERKSVERADPTKAMTAYQVTREGEDYKHVSDGEVVIIGDSQAFAHFGAGFASHIARVLGIDITDLALSSGAHWSGQRLAHLGEKQLRERKAVVMILTGAAIGRNNWSHVEIPEGTTVPGLLSLGMFDEANKMVANHKGDLNELGIDESYINQAAYRMVATSAWEEAEAAFKLNTFAFPKSANAWDSLAEFYARRDRKEDTIKAAHKALSLDPSSELKKNTLKSLRRVGADTSQWEEPAIELTDAQMEIFLGTYHLTENTTVEIVKEDKRLVALVTGAPKLVMTPTGTHTFETDGPNLKFTEKDGGMHLFASMGNDSREGMRVKDDKGT